MNLRVALLTVVTLALPAIRLQVAQSAPRPKRFAVETELGEFVLRPGETRTIRGILQNQLGQRVWLSGARVQFGGRGLKGDQDVFLRQAPAALPSGRKSKRLPFVGLTVRPDTEPGTYEATLLVLGGRHRGDQDVLGQARFLVTVRR